MISREKVRRRMENSFGKTLRKLLQAHGVKEQAFADALQYDVTYISKWLNGSSLPSERNIGRLIENIGAFLEDESCREPLMRAYRADLQQRNFFKSREKELYLAHDRADLIEAIRSALLLCANDPALTIRSTVDLFRLFEDQAENAADLFQDLPFAKISIDLVLDPQTMAADSPFYSTAILSFLSGIRGVEVTITRRLKELPAFIVVNDRFAAQILFDIRGRFLACYGYSQAVTEAYDQEAGRLISADDLLLAPAVPGDLRRTNVQLDSYSDTRQRLIYYEAPALLFPDDVAAALIEGAEDAADAAYLTKLMHIFKTRTCHAKIDLVLFSSALIDYVETGRLSIGNVPRKLSRDQVRSHLKYLQEVMKTNPDFCVYLVRDTISRYQTGHTPPSLFLDSHAVSIECPLREGCSKYHMSHDESIRAMMSSYFDQFLQNAACRRILPQELDNYV